MNEKINEILFEMLKSGVKMEITVNSPSIYYQKSNEYYFEYESYIALENENSCQEPTFYLAGKSNNHEEVILMGINEAFKRFRVLHNNDTLIELLNGLKWKGNNVWVITMN